MNDPGRRRFTFLSCLGRGGFGEVYQARMSSPGGLESIVAVKVLRAELSADADAVRRLRDEGRLLARLNHPTILKVFDLILLAGRVGLVAEYVDGADLNALVRSRRADGTLSEGMSLRGLMQVIGSVAACLHAAWSIPGADGAPLRLVHRDIKPTNIRIGRHGEVKLLDFGIAHFQDDQREAETASGVIVGSMPYMAPERFLDRQVRSASDVFALACTLYEGLVGERFFPKAHARRVGSLALERELFQAYLIERLALVPPDVPERAAQLLVEMLDYDHQARPTAEEVAARCDALADELSGPTLRRWCRETHWPAPRPETGALVGQELYEGSLQISGPSGGRPRIQTAPPLTVDTRLPPPLGFPGEAAAFPGGSPEAPREASTAEKPHRRGVFAAIGCGALGLAILLIVSGVVTAFAILALAWSP